MARAFLDYREHARELALRGANALAAFTPPDEKTLLAEEDLREFAKVDAE